MRELDAGDFAFVMATGIVSIAAALRGLAVFSEVVLGVACAGWVVLAAALAGGLLRGRGGRPRLQSFALVAATAVLGARFMLAGFGDAALALWVFALLLYVVLLVRRPSLAPAVGGSLLLVVATESLAVLADLVALRRPHALLDVALAAWLLGLVLYPLVVWAVVQALRRRPRFAPDLWIVMGAAAIVTLAGTELLVAGRDLRLLSAAMRPLRDVDLATWALASALVLPLGAAELRARLPRLDAARWSFVFPLGMYSAASTSLGRAEKLAPLSTIGCVAFAVAVAAWTLVAVGLARRSLPAR